MTSIGTLLEKKWQKELNVKLKRGKKKLLRLLLRNKILWKNPRSRLSLMEIKSLLLMQLVLKRM